MDTTHKSNLDLVGVSAVAQITGLSETTIRTYVQRQTMPPPLPIEGSDALTWERRTIIEWDESRRGRGRPRKEPPMDTTSYTVTADVYRGVVTVDVPESEDTDVWRGPDGILRTLTLNVGEWGVEELGMDRVDTALREAGWTRVSGWDDTWDDPTCRVVLGARS